MPTYVLAEIMSFPDEGRTVSIEEFRIERKVPKVDSEICC